MIDAKFLNPIDQDIQVSRNFLTTTLVMSVVKARWITNKALGGLRPVRWPGIGSVGLLN
jgi:hypothetical protein